MTSTLNFLLATEQEIMEEMQRGFDTRRAWYDDTDLYVTVFEAIVMDFATQAFALYDNRIKNGDTDDVSAVGKGLKMKLTRAMQSFHPHDHAKPALGSLAFGPDFVTFEGYQAWRETKQTTR